MRTDFFWSSIQTQIAEDEDPPLCERCGGEADMFIEGEHICDPCDAAASREEDAK